MKTTIVYLLHFDAPYKGAQHYLGSTTDLGKRIARHQSGDGSKLMKAVVEVAGIKFQVSRIWLRPNGDGRQYERMLKGRHNHKSLCPLCK